MDLNNEPGYLKEIERILAHLEVVKSKEYQWEIKALTPELNIFKLVTEHGIPFYEFGEMFLMSPELGSMILNAQALNPMVLCPKMDIEELITQARLLQEYGQTMSWDDHVAPFAELRHQPTKHQA